jgi:peptidoglycan/LPS O-acetylase OafA/YrhL
LAGFALGMLFYERYRTRWGYAFLKRSSVFAVCFAGILAAMHFDAHQLLIVALFPLSVLSAAYNTSGLKRLLEARPLQRLGDWSFSIYMVHIPLVFVYYAYLVAKDPTLFTRPPQGFGPNPDYLEGWWYCLVLMVVTLPAAALLYRYVEVPSRNFLNARFKTARPELVAAT